MALTRMSEKWNGIKRTNGSYSVETCYSVFNDAGDANAVSYLNVSGLSIYTDNGSTLSDLLPITVTIQINSGDVYSYSTGSTIHEGIYSPSMNWMNYAATVTSTERISIPDNVTTFTIHVTVTPNGGSAYSFDETGYRPLKNSVTAPASMVTGRVYNFTLSSNIPYGNLFTSNAILSYAPEINRIVVAGVLEYGYVDPYTRVSSATSAFNTVQFAVANPNVVINGVETQTSGTANISIQTWYLSQSFTNGILILDLSAQVPIASRPEIDSDLKPVLTANTVTVSGTNSINTGHTSYVHKQSFMTITPSAQFKYGDSFSYIHRDNGDNIFSTSITMQATGVEPGTSYVRPDTGNTVTAGEETISGVTVSVYGSKWGLPSDTITKTFYVIWYHAPKVTNFTVHRAKRVSTTTSYRFGDYYYQKDDSGTYCIVEYTIIFASLGGNNTTQVILQYGSSSRVINIPASGSGFYVFSAGSAAMDVSVELTDRFYRYPLTTTIKLSTSNILIDYLSGGKGMAIGKTATRQNTLDIDSAWSLLMYQATVNGTDLVSWMRNVDTRLSRLENG